MASIKLQGDTSGELTISAPAVAGTNTLNLPASTGTLLTTTGDGSQLTGLPAGYTDTDALTLFNASGSAPVYACRAWVNFNGTGTVAIRASGNVSSVTDNGVGIHTINYTTAMPNTNYSVVGMVQRDSGQGIIGIRASTQSPLYSTTSTKFFITSASGVAVDCPTVCVSVFR